MTDVELIVVEDAADLRRRAADRIIDVLDGVPEATVMPATGSTPMGIYDELAARAARGSFDASRLRVVQLDEYVGVDELDRRSLYGWLRRSFVQPLGVPEQRVVRLRGDDADLALACRRYDDAVAELGGLDLAILGLGPNGHLGFNEPPSDASSPTRVVELSPASITSNATYWGSPEAVPRRAVTAGMTVIGAARCTILVVSGSHKHEIVHRALEGEVTPEVPASFLQRRSGVVVIADRPAWGERARRAPRPPH